MDNCPCGKKATGSINGHSFCDNPTCIDKAVLDSINPFKQALAKTFQTEPEDE